MSTLQSRCVLIKQWDFPGALQVEAVKSTPSALVWGGRLEEQMWILDVLVWMWPRTCRYILTATSTHADRVPAFNCRPRNALLFWSLWPGGLKYRCLCSLSCKSTFYYFFFKNCTVPLLSNFTWKNSQFPQINASTIQMFHLLVHCLVSSHRRHIHFKMQHNLTASSGDQMSKDQWSDVRRWSWMVTKCGRCQLFSACASFCFFLSFALGLII